MPTFGDDSYYQSMVEKRKRAKLKYAHITGYNKKSKLIERFMRK